MTPNDHESAPSGGVLIPSMNKLHIYPQPFWHEEAVIVGDRIALLKLINTLLQAVIDGEANLNSVMTDDGEGYDVRVVCLEPEDPKWDNVLLPYASLTDIQSGRTKYPSWTT